VQMGDGAGAVVLGAPTDASGARIETVFYGSLAGIRKPGISLLQGGSGQPASHETRTAHFMHDYESVRTQGLELLQEGLRVATEAGIAGDSVDWWVVHPANGRMAEYASKWLKVRQERIFCEAATLGNLGSAAIWVTFDRLRRSGRLAAGDRVLVLGAEASKYMYGGFLYVHGALGI
jgi:3-oxoacyl-[acyl-carrier-protein] synthase-3